MIPFVREMDPRYGEPVAVSPRVRRVLARNPSPFTYLGTGTYVVGSGEVAVIDPGPEDPEHLDALMRAVAGETVRAILTTHTHLDHSPLAGPLQKLTGAPIYGRADPAAESLDEAGQTSFRPDVEIADRAVVSGSGWSLEALATPGHASNHVVYALLEENGLFSGDHVMGWSTTIVSPPDGDMDDYIASLERVRARNFSVIWPTHGPPIEDVEPFLRAYRDHRLNRESQIRRALAAGARSIPDLVADLYADVDAKLHPAAARSVLAHLIRLVSSGEVTTDGPPRVDGAYRIS